MIIQSVPPSVSCFTYVWCSPCPHVQPAQYRNHEAGKPKLYSHLRGSGIGSWLEAKVTVPALPDLLICEVPLILGGCLGPEGWSGKFWVFLCSSCKGEEAESHLRKIATLEEVRSLEHLLVRTTILLGSCKEGLDVLHKKKGRTLQEVSILFRRIRLKRSDTN